MRYRRWLEKPRGAMTTEEKRPDERVLNILLVEDDAVDVMTVKRAFARNHITNPLFVAGDGLEALQKLRSDEIPRDRRMIPVTTPSVSVSG